MQRRSEEIQAKRAKLAELKRQRELRDKEFSSSRQSIGGSGSPHAAKPSPNRTETQEELNKYVDGLLGSEDQPRTPSSKGRPSSLVAGRRESGVPRVRSQSPKVKGVESGTQTLSLSGFKTVYEVRSEPPRKETVSYSKGVQTSPPRKSRSRSGSADSRSEQSPSAERRPRRKSSKRQKEREEEIRVGLRKEIEAELKNAQGSFADVEEVDEVKHANFPARALSQEEREAVTSSNDFLDFVERSSKVIERALDDEYDVLADYQQGNLNGLNDEDEELGSTGQRGRRVKEVLQFYDERWSRGRIVSDIGFSPKYPELILASYTKNATPDPDGLIQIWNTHMHSRPETTLHANSDILTAQFSPFHPSLILGGTYSGQLLLWDTRTRTSQHHPVQKTPLTGTGHGHTHPIYSINVVGTQNAHNILSTSTDGVVCSWSVDMMSRPQEYLELHAPPGGVGGLGDLGSTSVGAGLTPYNLPQTLSPTTTAFPPTDPSYFLAGTEAGNIHLIHRYDRAGTKAGVDASTAYVGHAAPVMSLDFHKATGPLDLGDLMLSTGLDWTVRLWRVRTPGGFGGVDGGGGSSRSGYTTGGARESFAGVGGQPAARERRNVKPLLELPRDEPVYDAKWSPVRPGVWACVDGAGYLEVWDLNAETGVPVARVCPTQRREDGSVIPRAVGVGGQAGMGMGMGRGRLGGRGYEEVGRSLNKCAWESGEGRRVAVGGLGGVVSLFEVGGELGGTENVRQEEWMGVKKLVARLEGGAR